MDSAVEVPVELHALLESVGVNALDLAVQVVEVVNEVLNGDLAITSLESEAFAELSLLLSDGFLTRGNGGVVIPLASGDQVVNLDATVLVGNLTGEGVHEAKLLTAHLTADGGDELVVADNTVAVFVEVFEDALEFSDVQFHAELAEDPLDFVAVEDAVAVLVHLDEKLGQETHALVAVVVLEGRQNLVENLLRGVSVHAEDGVNIGVVAGAADSDHGSHLLVVDFTGTVGVKTVEEGLHLDA